MNSELYIKYLEELEKTNKEEYKNECEKVKQYFEKIENMKITNKYVKVIRTSYSKIYKILAKNMDKIPNNKQALEITNIISKKINEIIEIKIKNYNDEEEQIEEIIITFLHQSSSIKIESYFPQQKNMERYILIYENGEHYKYDYNFKYGSIPDLIADDYIKLIETKELWHYVLMSLSGYYCH